MGLIPPADQSPGVDKDFTNELADEIYDKSEKDFGGDSIDVRTAIGRDGLIQNASLREKVVDLTIEVGAERKDFWEATQRRTRIIALKRSEQTKRKENNRMDLPSIWSPPTVMSADLHKEGGLQLIGVPLSSSLEISSSLDPSVSQVGGVEGGHAHASTASIGRVGKKRGGVLCMQNLTIKTEGHDMGICDDASKSAQGLEYIQGTKVEGRRVSHFCLCICSFDAKHLLEEDVRAH